MRWLWLTLADPDPPTNGQFLYVTGLIHAVAAAGVELHVIGFDLPHGWHRDGDQIGKIHWHLAPHRPHPPWRTVFSPLPRDVARTHTHGMALRVTEALSAGPWDAIILDSWVLGWTLPALRAHCAARSTRLVYLAHNHEESVARALIEGERRPLHRVVRRLDALKARRLERQLARSVALIAADADADCETFQRKWPNKPVAFIPPGYSGPRIPSRPITPDVPRRAVILGTFDWAAKRQSLEGFLAVADPLFAAAGIELQVVGQAEETFLNRLRRTARATQFTGRVARIQPYLQAARLALVPDRVGGFKLKGLDYVFHRVPIAAMRGALPGMPLRQDESAFFYDTPAEMAAGVIGLIDDFARLTALQEKAYAACRDLFDWGHTGRQFVAALARCAAPGSAPEQALSKFAQAENSRLDQRDACSGEATAYLERSYPHRTKSV